MPSSIRDLEHRLSAIRFEPRASLKAELLGRLRRDVEPPPKRWRRVGQALGLAAAILGVGLAIFLLWATLLKATGGM